MDHFNCNNCGAPINWWDKYVKEICNDEKWYDGMQALAEGHQPIPPTEIEYYKCKQCGKEFTPKEAKDIENQRLQTRASQLNCSIEIVKIIENLQKRIKDLEKNKLDKPEPDCW